ncbi:ABC transporter permease [Xanthobacter aminoxidans]|uniref:ABC transporter permease n=1 Tax=Xanthobacter aminoxidans TaxID=186280 RepID=UPI0020230795|nr:ABC transporter permease [Xanthobacter aminoxidans]MCL8385418.1 ABC transporter permease [Xanthobacter aminoxidans]
MAGKLAGEKLKLSFRGGILIPLVSLLVIVVIFGALAPTRFLTIPNAQVVLTQAAVLAIVGFGVTLVIISGSIDLSVGSVAAVAGIVAAQLVPQVGPIPALLLGVAIGGVAGAVNGLVFVYLRVPSFLVTLAMLTTARGIAYLISDGESFTVYGVPILGDLGAYPTVVLIAAALLALFWILLNKTQMGLYIRALGGSEHIARLVGLPLNRIKVSLFMLSGLAAGLGGLVLASRQGAATPNLGTSLELDVITAVVLGGTPLTGCVGNVTNTVIGAIAISALANGLIIIGLTSDVQMIVKGMVLVLAILVALERSKIGIIK